METETTKYFDDLIELAQSFFDEVEYEIDSTLERAILRIQAEYGQYRVFITELLSDLSRQYRYYLLRGIGLKLALIIVQTRVLYD